MQLFKMAEFEAVHEMGGSYYRDDNNVCVAGWVAEGHSSELPNDTCEKFVIWIETGADPIHIEEFAADSFPNYVKSVSDYKRRFKEVTVC